MAEAFITRRGKTGVVAGEIVGSGNKSITIPDLIGKKNFLIYTEKPVTVATYQTIDNVVIQILYRQGAKSGVAVDQDKTIESVNFSFDETTGTITCSMNNDAFYSAVKYQYVVF